MGPRNRQEQPGARRRRGTGAPVRTPAGLTVRRVVARLRERTTGPSDAGMATAEYAIVTIAAVGFGGLLITILASAEVRGALLGLIRGALSV